MRLNIISQTPLKLPEVAAHSGGTCGMYVRVSNKKHSQTFGSCSRTRVTIVFKLAMNTGRNVAKVMVTH